MPRTPTATALYVFFLSMETERVPALYTKTPCFRRPLLETTWRCTISNLALTTKQPRVKQKSIHYEAIFTLLTLGYVLMDRANEYSNAVQKKIQIAIGDIPNYPGFHSGEGASLGFMGNGSA